MVVIYRHVDSRIVMLNIIILNSSNVKRRFGKMIGANLQHLLAMVLYMAAVVGIGAYFAKRANGSAEAYFLGGRSLGPWVTAFSASSALFLHM